MPQIGRVEISIIEEVQSRWLAFQQKQLDFSNCRRRSAPRRSTGRQAEAALVDAGRRRCSQVDRPRHHLHVLQFPRSGRRRLLEGKDRAAPRDDHGLRRRRGDQGRAQGPGGAAADADSARRRRARSELPQLNQYDPVLANKLLDHFGYKKGADGYRTHARRQAARASARPRGSTAIDRELNELWKKSMDAIGIRMEFDARASSPTTARRRRRASCMMWGAAWIADYPDGDNFMQLLYGPNTGQSNNGCYESKAFDAFYDKSRRAARFAGAQPAVPRDVAADGSRRRVEPARFARAQPADPAVGQGYKKHPILHAECHVSRRRGRRSTAMRAVPCQSCELLAVASLAACMLFAARSPRTRPT